MPVSGNCFVIMPFRPELHYMYLFIEQHIGDAHNLKCERGDSRYDKEGILDKIQRYIKDADVIIADCSGRNPNVFYELGMAHAMNKPVILITGDDIDQAPTDIKSFEFIRYRLDDHESFLNRLDAALNNVLGNFDELYDAARILFDQFRQDKNLGLEEAAKDEFVRKVASFARTSPLPAPSERRAMALHIVPAMYSGIWSIDRSEILRAWIDENYPEDGG